MGGRLTAVSKSIDALEALRSSSKASKKVKTGVMAPGTQYDIYRLYSKEFLESSWKVPGKFLASSWKVPGNLLEICWKVHGR